MAESDSLNRIRICGALSDGNNSPIWGSRSTDTFVIFPDAIVNIEIIVEFSGCERECQLNSQWIYIYIYRMLLTSVSIVLLKDIFIMIFYDRKMKTMILPRSRIRLLIERVFRIFFLESWKTCNSSKYESQDKIATEPR